MAARMKKSMALKKRKLEDLSMDDFMTGDFESSSSETDKTPVKAKKNKKKHQKLSGAQQQIGTTEKKDNKGVSRAGKGVVSKHAASLGELKQQDPEFYKFLQEEDESLLKFGELSGSDVTDSSDDDDDTSKSEDLERETDSEQEDIELPESSDDEGDSNTGNTPTLIHNKHTKQKHQAKPPEASKKKKLKEDAEPTKKTSKDNQDASDDDDDDDVGEDWQLEGSDEDSDDELHVPQSVLEEMTDSDDDDDDDNEEETGGDGEKKKQRKTGAGGGTPVTMKMVKAWEDRFKSGASAALIHEVVQAFHAAVQQTTTQTDTTKYVVQGGKVFNGVVRVCLLEMAPGLQLLLELPDSTDLQKPAMPNSQSKRWKKVKLDVKFYLTDTLQLLSSLSEENMVNIVLKHIHKLIAYFICFPKLTKALIKKLILIWSEGQETSRVLAFLCINRAVRARQDQLLENCVKHMYMAYVKNCKFTSPSALPNINFMQRSYVEIFSLDFSLAYQYAFMYIRQLAIHLRSAIATKKKESCQAVYNWQYVHCIGLWSRVLSMCHPNEVLEPLIYPLVQTTIGTIKLIGTARYYPLRFHCVRSLSLLSRSTNTFIPILPFLLEVFEMTDFNKKPKAASMKPLNFACILKLSKPQLTERSFKEGVIDQLYELLLEYFHGNAHTIGFPELALPALLQLKGFLKSCKVSLFTKQIRQIVDKVRENSDFISARRRSCNLSLSDKQQVARWERECEDAGTPLAKFYKTWRKLRDRELMHQIAGRDAIIDMDKKGFPEIERAKVGPLRASEEDKQEFSALFEGDSDDEDQLATRFLAPGEKKKLQKAEQQSKKEKAGGEDSEGEYSDLDSDDLAQLAGSGSDDSDAEMDDGKEDDHDQDVDEGGDSDSDDDKVDDNDDGEEADDIVEEFTMSSDED